MAPLLAGDPVDFDQHSPPFWPKGPYTPLGSTPASTAPQVQACVVHLQLSQAFLWSPATAQGSPPPPDSVATWQQGSAPPLRGVIAAEGVAIPERAVQSAAALEGVGSGEAGPLTGGFSDRGAGEFGAPDDARECFGWKGAKSGSQKAAELESQVGGEDSGVGSGSCTSNGSITSDTGVSKSAIRSGVASLPDSGGVEEPSRCGLSEVGVSKPRGVLAEGARVSAGLAGGTVSRQQLAERADPPLGVGRGICSVAETLCCGGDSERAGRRVAEGSAVKGLVRNSAVPSKSVVRPEDASLRSFASGSCQKVSPPS